MKNFTTTLLKSFLFSLIFLSFGSPAFGNYESSSIKPPYLKLFNLSTADVIDQQEIHMNSKYSNCEDRFKVYNNIGVSFSGNKDLENAISNYLKSLSHNPNNSFVQFNLANAYLLGYENKKAIELYLTLLGIQEINQEFLKLHLARAYEQDQKIAAAISLYKEVQLYEAAFNGSVLLKNTKQFKQALLEAKRALSFQRNNEQAQLNYASLLYLNGDISKGIDYLKKSIKSGTNVLLKQNELANYYLSNGQLKLATKTFEKLTRTKALNPYYNDALIGLSRVALKQHNYVNCVDRLKKVIKRKPNNALAHLTMAKALTNLKEYDRATLHFKLALDNGLVNEAVIGLAVVSHKQGNYELAQEYYHTFSEQELAQISYDDLIVIALNEYKLGSIEQTIHYANKAIKKNPSRPEAYGYLGKFHYDNFEILKAQQQYKKAISLAKDKSPYRVNLANCYAQTGRYRSALTAFNQAIVDDPTYAKAHSGRAMCLLMLNKVDQAISSIDKAILFDPNEPFNYMNKAYVLSTKARQEEDSTFKNQLLMDAKANIETAKRIDNRPVSVHYDNNLALVYMELGELEIARALLEKQVNRVTLNNTGVYYKRNNAIGNATQKFNEALAINPF